MPRAVPALYLVILVLFVTAGSLLTARTEQAATGATVPEDCSRPPEVLVERYFPGTTAGRDDSVSDAEAVRYGRWVDEEGDVLIELRCARAGLRDVRGEQSAVAEASEGEGRELLVETDPVALLADVPEGSIIRQLDADAGLIRTWFIRAPLTVAEAEDVVNETLRSQQGPGDEGP